MRFFTLLTQIVKFFTGIDCRDNSFYTGTTPYNYEKNKTGFMEKFFTLLTKMISVVLNREIPTGTAAGALQPVPCCLPGTATRNPNKTHLHDVAGPAASFAFISPQAINHPEKKRFMKTSFVKSGIFIVAFVFANLFFANLLNAQTVVTITSSGNFTVPPGVTSITVQAWGGGAAGSSGTGGNGARGGGGGGAYASSVLTVTPNSVFAVTIGAGGVANGSSNGKNTVFGTNLVVAAGAATADGSTSNGGPGGTVAASTGTVRFAGGAGGARDNGNDGGGGGGSATTTAAGGAGANGTGTAGGAGGAGTGAGGNGGGNNAVGVVGFVPGGGGGGKGNGGANSGNGAAGQITITYCAVPAAPGVTSPITYCQNDATSVLTATGSGLLWYTAATGGGTGSSTAPTPSSATAGTTSYFVSQTVGCESQRAEIDVVVNPQPSSTVNGQTNINCFGGSDGTITIQASGGTAPYFYSVDNGATYQSSANNPYTYTGLTANTPYRIRVKDNKGCISTSAQ